MLKVDEPIVPDDVNADWKEDFDFGDAKTLRDNDTLRTNS